MGGRGGGAPAGRQDAGATSMASARDMVRQAFAQFQTSGQEWISLANIRDSLAARGISNRERQDEILMDMRRHDSDVRIIPIANTKGLTKRESDAALNVGAGPLHAIGIDSRYTQWQSKKPR